MFIWGDNMALSVYFSNIATKQPNSTMKYAITTANFPTAQRFMSNVLLKDNTSITKPVLQLNTLVSGGSSTTYIPSYAYIPQFNRFYFVKDVVQINHSLWEYYLEVDAMGTYSDLIKASSQWCERSSGGFESIIDPFICRQNRVPTTLVTRQSIQGITTSGTYVIETAGPGGVKLYAVDNTNLQNLVNEIFDQNIYDGTVASDNIKATFNPFKYVLSCRWFPVDLTSASPLPAGTVTPVPIPFGWWSAPGAMGAEMPQPGNTVFNAGSGANLSTFSALISLPSIDGTPGFYNLNENWITHNLYIPGCGDIPIPAEFSGSTIRVSIYVDYYTGQCNFEVFAGTPLVVISRGVGKLGIDIRLSDMTIDMGNLGTTVVRSAIETNPNILEHITRQGQSFDMGSIVLNAFNAVMPGNSLQGALSPNLTLTSATGNVYYLIQRPDLELTTKYITPFNVTDVQTKFNLPDNTNELLSSLTGFTKCVSPKLDLPCTIEEKAIIYKYMQEGFYIE